MRLLTNNIIENASIMTMTNPDSNYPIENLISSMLEDIVKASTGTTTMTFLFDGEQEVDVFFIGYHNASNIVITFKDAVDTVLDSFTLEYPDMSIKKYIAKLTDVRQIKVELTSSDGNVFVGNIAAGVYTQCYNVNKPLRILFEDSSVFEQVDGGQTVYRKGTKLRSMDITLSKNTQQQADKFEEAYDHVGKGKPFWFDRYEHTDVPAIFGYFSSNHTTEEIDTLTTIRFSFREAK